MDIDDYLSFDFGYSYLTGVSDLSSRTMRYMMRPHSMISSDFMKYYMETIGMMRKFMHTESKFIPMVGPGRVAIDSAVNSFLEPGEKALFIDNGYWGRYPAELIAPYYDVKAVTLSLDSRKPMDIDKIEKTLKTEKNIKAVHAVHVETETGAINPVRQIGELVQKHAPDALYMVDSASAFPGNPIKVDDWGIDVDYFVSHKGFNGPSGLNFLALNDKAWEKVQKRKTKPKAWYTSVETWYHSWVDFEDDGRECLASFPNPQFHAMRAKLDLMETMGEKKFIAKSEIASRAIREGVKAMSEPRNKLVVRGPMCAACPGCAAVDPNLAGIVEEGRYCSQTMFALGYPKGFDWRKFMQILEQRFWMVAPHFGFGDSRKDGYFYSANAMRIGFIREDEQLPRNIISILAATGMGLVECGLKGIDWKRGVETAVDVMREYEDIGFTMYMKDTDPSSSKPKF